MNIRQLSTGNRPLLTIDDPSIYQEASATYSEFVKVATINATAPTDTGQSDTLYLVGTDSAHYVPYVYCTDDQWRVMPNPFGRGPTLPYPILDRGDQAIYQLNDNLVAIDNHLYALRKELSYWNLYQISYSVDKTDDFSTILSSLAPGEALIINFEGLLSYGGIEYKRGDVIIRLSNGKYVTIEGSVAGFYYPAAVTQNGSEKTYTLEYRYYQGITPSSDSATLTSEPITNPALSETFNIIGGEASASFVYGIKREIAATASVATINFDIAKWGSGTEQTKIPPVIKIFNADGEEIWTDFTCSATDQATQYTLNISSLPTGIIKYVYVK